MTKKSDADKHAESQLARYEHLIKAAETMTDAEKAELATWEKNHVTGDGAYTTSDWPGWNAIESRISH